MHSAPLSTKTLRGKYQISKNIFVTCYLDILEANDKEILVYVGLKHRADSLVPPGTRIYFNAEPINRINQRRNRDLDLFSITVLEVRPPENGSVLHVCTPINKEIRPNLRQHERRAASFPMQLAHLNLGFEVVDGSWKGVTLHCTSRRAMLSLTMGGTYPFTVEHKDMAYTLPGVIKHIQYDWKKHNHVIGVHFSQLPQDEQAVLNMLLDPHYTIELSNRQTIDTAQGKISADD